MNSDRYVKIDRYVVLPILGIIMLGLITILFLILEVNHLQWFSDYHTSQLDVTWFQIIRLGLLFVWAAVLFGGFIRLQFDL